MLSDEKINAVLLSTAPAWWDVPMDATEKFARAMEQEVTTTLIEQIRQDEALMARALASLDDYKDGAEWRAYDLEILTALRQRLEAKK